jgi:hypothetical protein
MPGNQAQTREEIRVSIGRMLAAIKLIEADASGTTTTFITDELATGAANDFNGMWLVFTSGQSNIDGQIRQITASTVSSNRVTLTFFPAVSNAPVDAATAELWDEWLDPEDIHGYIQQAVLDTTGTTFDHTEDITLHGGAKSRFDIPTTFELLTSVQLRERMTSQLLTNAGNLWNESVGTGFTVTQETIDLLYGLTSTKLVVDGAIVNGNLVSISIDSTDLSNQTHIEFPIKVDIAVAASDLVLRISATGSGADTDKIIAIPALSAGSEFWVRVAMDEVTSGFTPSEATAIISVALEYNANSKANIIWIGGVDSTQNDSYKWEDVPRHLWSIDKANRDLIISLDGAIGYKLIKLIGGDNPLLLDSDTDVNELPDGYMIYRAAGLALLSRGGGPGTDPDRNSQRANQYLGIAETERRKIGPIVNARYMV